VDARAIAIVGLGPKGLYCLERIAAEARARPLDEPLTVHLFERTAQFGASPVYDPAQPDHILVNVAVGEIDLWNAGDPPPVCGRGPSFLEWHQAVERPAVPLTGEEYLPRAVVGRYLIDGFQRILRHLPPGLDVVRHAGEVTDIRRVPDGYALAAEDGEVFAEKIMLATGHSRLRPGAIESRFEMAARENPRLTFIPFAYPVVETMAPIPAGARVSMLGIGLTFIDAVLELTEGRGGRFARDGDRLTYHRSGREPEVIYPFSRTGLPMTPKAADLPIEPRRLVFVTPENLRKRAPLELERDVLPLFELEMALRYYRIAGDRDALDACGGDVDAVRATIAKWLDAHPEHEPFDYRRVVDPIGARAFSNGGEYNAFVTRYMTEEIARARRGEGGCPVKAAISIWYDVRSAIGEVLPHGGLTAASHRRLVDDYFPRLKRVAFGPPIVNIEKLLALVEAGLLDFSVARSPRVETGESFELHCEANGSVAYAEVLVDARYPHVDVERDATPLYRNLVRRGLVRAFRNDGYSPGAIDMTAETRFVIGRDGTPNEDICVIGIPTESNLVGNLTIARDEFAGRWAARVMDQLRAKRPAWAPMERRPEHAQDVG
jgi:uncharacterized NAD(P)/FAD-binding protein YdhS